MLDGVDPAAVKRAEEYAAILDAVLEEVAEGLLAPLTGGLSEVVGKVGEVVGRALVVVQALGRRLRRVPLAARPPVR